jgi:hypothetical protein
VQPGQVTVEYDDVIAVDRGTLQRRMAVQRDVDGHTLSAQSRRDGLGELLVVLDHQYAHRHLRLRLRLLRTLRPACPPGGNRAVRAPVPVP